MWPFSLINAGPKSIDHLRCLEMLYQKIKDDLIKAPMNYGDPSSSSDSETAYKMKKCFVKNCHATFDKKMKFNFHVLKLYDDDLFKNRSKRSTFVTRPFLTMLNLEVNIISLQQLEYEMDRTDYPIDYNCFEIGYCCYSLNTRSEERRV